MNFGGLKYISILLFVSWNQPETWVGLANVLLFYYICRLIVSDYIIFVLNCRFLWGFGYPAAPLCGTLNGGPFDSNNLIE